MEWLSDPQIWLSLITLTVLEIVLGIDNVVFISILAGKLPENQQAKARSIGLTLALITRLLLLAAIAWMAKLTRDLFFVMGQGISGRDLILIVGGLFLLAKSTHEIHEKLEGEEGEKSRKIIPKFGYVIFQILMLDVVFSLDSVITAIGMAQELWVMVVAVIAAVIFMLLFAGAISSFVNRHPTVKMLALSFLILIGVALIADGLDRHIPKGYIYFAMAFSVGVEMLNLRMRAKHKAVELRQPY
jgi:predicted tellurium resistance membrane protein TerC